MSLLQMTLATRSCVGFHDILSLMAPHVVPFVLNDINDSH